MSSCENVRLFIVICAFCLGAEPPPDITVPFNVTASPGSTALLTCVVASSVRFNLTWQRGGMDIRAGTRSRLTSDLSLEIQHITTDDAGWYNCVAANEGGVSSSRVYLSVQGKCVYRHRGVRSSLYTGCCCPECQGSLTHTFTQPHNVLSYCV